MFIPVWTDCAELVVKQDSLAQAHRPRESQRAALGGSCLLWWENASVHFEFITATIKDRAGKASAQQKLRLGFKNRAFGDAKLDRPSNLASFDCGSTTTAISAELPNSTTSADRR